MQFGENNWCWSNPTLLPFKHGLETKLFFFYRVERMFALEKKAVGISRDKKIEKMEDSEKDKKKKEA